MLKRHGFGASDAIGAIVALGVTGLVGYSMVSGQCLLGTCDVGKASSPTTPAAATVVSADQSYDCSTGGCDVGTSGLNLSSETGGDDAPAICEGCRAIAGECECEMPQD